MTPQPVSFSRLLRLEGFLLFICSVMLYEHFQYEWKLFFTLILLPDVALFAYLINSRTGAIIYNLTHSTIGALLCLIIWHFSNAPILLAIALIWLTHIGIDRALGYGLKSVQGFHFTHLGIIGRYKQ